VKWLWVRGQWLPLVIPSYVDFTISYCMSTSADLKSTIEAHILSLDLGARKPANLYEPMAYILSLKGKRIRPILTLLAYQAVSGEVPTGALNLAASVELFHNFTLMHDDIMDRAPVRRGMPSVHVKWNEDIAILSGDALFAYSMGLVVKDFPEHAARLAEEFASVAMGVCEGQQEDLDLASQAEATIPAYIEMIRKKTAVLLGGCLSMGAMASGAEESLVEDFRNFGEYAGIAFQLQDDLMDAFPPANFGKQVGGDILENKKTFLYLKALELGDEAQTARLRELFGTQDGGEEKVKEVLGIFEALNIPQHTQQLIEDYFEKARNLAASLNDRANFGAVLDYLQVIAKRKL